MKSDVPDPDPDDEFTQDLDPFSLIKIGKQWKFDGANEFLTGVFAGFSQPPLHRPCGETVSYEIALNLQE